MEIKYVIVPVRELTHEVLDAVHQTSFRTVRRSANGKKCVLSYHGDQPPCLNGYKELSQEQALTEMSTRRWTGPKRPWWKWYAKA